MSGRRRLTVEERDTAERRARMNRLRAQPWLPDKPMAWLLEKERAAEAKRLEGAAEITTVVCYRALPSNLLVRSGVYFLLREGVVVYVGQSNNVLRRLSQHQERKEIDFDGFSFFDVPVERLDEEERYYIKQLRPKYNQRLLGKRAEWWK